MALFQECSLKCARKVLDTADIVREAMFRQLSRTQLRFGEIDGIILKHMRIIKATAILVCGPVLGILIAIVLFIFAIPQDPNFASNGGHAAPGDGFLGLGFVVVSLLISVPLSILGAGIMLFRKTNTKNAPPNAQ